MAEPSSSSRRRTGRSGRTLGWLARSLIVLPSVALAILLAAMTVLWPRRKGPAFAAKRRISPGDFERTEPGRGRLARAPWEIPPRGWKDILWRTWRKALRDNLPTIAGGVSFYLLLAAFPAVTAFVSVYGLFLDEGTIGQVLTQLSAVFPADALSLIGGQMLRLAGQRHEILSATVAASTLVSAFSANAGMKALVVGLNLAYRERETRPFLRRTLLTYGATLALVLVVTSAAILTVAAPLTLHALGLHRIHLWWAPFRWALVWALAALSLAIAYRYGPSRRRPRWPWVSAGGALAALAWLSGSLLFTFYVDTFSHLGAMYGSLGAVVAFMLWMWFSVMVVLIGAELNAETEHQTACDTTVGPDRPLGRRGAVVADSVGRAFTVSPKEAKDLAEEFVRRQRDALEQSFGLDRDAG